MKVHDWSIRVVVLAAVLAALLLTTGGAFASVATATYPAKVGYPNSIASTGDSITRAFNAGPIPFTDAPEYSWSTGDKSAVNSHYSRILAANPLINGQTFNDAITGELMSGLNGEVANVVSQQAEYVTILMGANDACTSSPVNMTPVATYRAEFEAAMRTLTTGLPDARIFVSSLPNIYNLWAILHTNSQADERWTRFHICQSMLAQPTSTARRDMLRRVYVLKRVHDYNIQLAQVCAEYIHCRFDNNAVFNTAFTTADINTRDYFHPSVAGQALLAATTYAATFDFTDMTAPMSTATVTPVTGGDSVTLAATDNVGVAGIEYQLGTTTWTRYTASVFVSSGSTLIYRAVDVNGNIEASHSITAP
jgi:lysophospholipase L1-like esterase